MIQKQFSITDMSYTIELEVIIIGFDLLMTLTGGSNPHIGTVTTYCKENNQKEVVRFPSHSGRFHKDDVLADVILEEIKGLDFQNCTITSGVHVDHITKEQIVASFDMVKNLSKQFSDWLMTHPIKADKPVYQKKK